MSDKRKQGIPEQGDIFGDPSLSPDGEYSMEKGAPYNDATPSEGKIPEGNGKNGKKRRMSKKAEKSFDELLDRLDEIVETMEGGGLPLDEMMKLYEEGVQKAEALTSMLADARTRVMKLVKNANGKPVLEQFEGEESL